MRLTEDEVAGRVPGVTVEELRIFIAEGWIVPASGEAGPLFDDLDLARVRLVRSLKDELGLPEEALGVVLSLMDQVHGLRRELRCLARAVERQPDAVRRAIARHHREEGAE